MVAHAVLVTTTVPFTNSESQGQGTSFTGSLSVSFCLFLSFPPPLHSTQPIYPTPPPPLHSTQPIYPTPPPPSSSDCRVAKMPVKTARRCWIPMHTIGKLVAGGGSSVIRQGTPPSFNHPLSFSQTLPSTPPNYLTPPPPPKQPPQPPQPSPPPLHVQLVTDVSSNP